MGTGLAGEAAWEHWWGDVRIAESEWCRHGEQIVNSRWPHNTWGIQVLHMHVKASAAPPREPSPRVPCLANTSGPLLPLLPSTNSLHQRATGAAAHSTAPPICTTSCRCRCASWGVWTGSPAGWLGWFHTWPSTAPPSFAAGPPAEKHPKSMSDVMQAPPLTRTSMQGPGRGQSRTLAPFPSPPLTGASEGRIASEPASSTFIATAGSIPGPLLILYRVASSASDAAPPALEVALADLHLPSLRKSRQQAHMYHMFVARGVFWKIYSLQMGHSAHSIARRSCSRIQRASHPRSAPWRCARACLHRSKVARL